MSLVNDVLTDLQARRAAVSTPLHGLHAAADDRVTARPARWRRRGAAAVALLLGAALSMWLLPAGNPVDTSKAATAAAPGAPDDTPSAIDAPDGMTARTSHGATGTPVPAPAQTAAAAVPQTGPSVARPFALRVATRLAQPPKDLPRRFVQPPRPAAASTVATAVPVAAPRPARAAPMKRVDETGRLRRDGLAALRAGEPAVAEKLFTRLVGLTPAVIEPHLLLHASLKAQARHADARAALAGALDRVGEPAPVAAVLARELLADERAASAVDVLTAYRPVDRDDPQYESLLAAALQRAGRHADATEIYAVLVEADPANGAWWVGLGISQESMGEIEAARASFGEASRSTTLDAALADYVTRRLRLLETNS